MAILHPAQLSPSKPEILRGFLAGRSWGATGELEILGAYRFDDPAGEVGIECHLVRVDGTIYHRPLTYRSEPLDGAEEHLVATMQHSVLGERFAHDGMHDEVALDCFRRALSGEQEQAVLEVHGEDGTVREVRPQSVTLNLEIDEGAQAPSDDELLDGTEFLIARTLGGLDGAVRLVARWDGGSGVVAAL